MSNILDNTAAQREQEALQQIINQLQQEYNTLVNHYNSVRESYKTMVQPLCEQREAVRQLRDNIAFATHNTHVGTSQCCEALDAVIAKLNKAINPLSDL